MVMCSLINAALPALMGYFVHKLLHNKNQHQNVHGAKKSLLFIHDHISYNHEHYVGETIYTNNSSKCKRIINSRPFFINIGVISSIFYYFVHELIYRLITILIRWITHRSLISSLFLLVIYTKYWIQCHMVKFYVTVVTSPVTPLMNKFTSNIVVSYMQFIQLPNMKTKFVILCIKTFL